MQDTYSLLSFDTTFYLSLFLSILFTQMLLLTCRHDNLEAQLICCHLSLLFLAISVPFITFCSSVMLFVLLPFALILLLLYHQCPRYLPLPPPPPYLLSLLPASSHSLGTILCNFLSSLPFFPYHPLSSSPSPSAIASSNLCSQSPSFPFSKR